ncbi:MAG TPA: alginate export family protein [Bryobacteraceae bacterium]|nr:alginate export family protein [Bryobacteraceae bacterium]
MPTPTPARTRRIVGALVLLMSASARAQTPNDVAPCPKPQPGLPKLTYDENAEYLARPECRTGFLDNVQFIPLDERQTDYLSVGFWIRERGTLYTNPFWGASPIAGNPFMQQRYMLHADLHLRERFRFFVELASSLENNAGDPTPGLAKEKLYLHEGFFDIGLWKSGRDSVKLRGGRYEMILGSEDFVSTRDGRNIRRSFTGGQLTLVKANWNVDLFALRPTLDTRGYFDDPPNSGQSFWGVYGTHPLKPLPGGKIDVYYLGIDILNSAFDGKGVSRELRHTVGTRLWGSTDKWDYTWDFTGQWGSFREKTPIRAWAIQTDTGYRAYSLPSTPRFGVRAASFSGNQNPNSHTLRTFNSLFERGPYYSYAELFARRNLIALQPQATFHLPKSVSVILNPAFFWRQSTNDGLYAIGNTVEISGLRSSARYVTTQASVQLDWQINRHLRFFSEFADFFPGDFIKQATPGRTLNYWTSWLDIRY